MQDGIRNKTFWSEVILFIMLLAVAVTSCAGGGEDDAVPLEPQFPISVGGAATGETAVTRAGETKNLARNFILYGYKTSQSDAVSTIFEGYKVTYKEASAGQTQDNTNNYSYVDEANNQFIKYWDVAAKEYNFWGYTGYKSHFTNNDGTVLEIPGLSLSLTEPTDAEISEKLFSSLYHRAPASAGEQISKDVVRLEFKTPYAKVRVMFFAAEPLSSETLSSGEYFDNIKITEVSFAPSDNTKEIPKAGSLKVTYPKTGVGPESYSTDAPESIASLGFTGVTLDYTHGTASNNAELAVPTGGTEYYYVIPNQFPCSFNLTAKIDNVDKVATVPTEMMHWKPNNVYTYLFKISGGNKIEIYDVLIEPWHFGGAQNEEWKNW